jgi:hypothetical protein
MPPLPTINGIHRVAFSWRASASGPYAANVMHFYNASMDPDGLKTALDANVTTAMWAGCNNNVTCYQLTITPLDGTSATRLYTVSGSKWTGTGTASGIEPAASVVVSLKTANRGRRYRGRVYLPFPDEALVGDGSLTAATTTAQAAWDAFRTAMATASFPLHIASYGRSYHKTGGKGQPIVLTPVSWTAFSTAVTSITVEKVLGTQRRRQTRLRV